MIEWIILGGIAVVGAGIAASLYTVVPPEFADVVVQGSKRKVFCAHEDYREGTNSAAYFKIPSKFFIGNLGMNVSRMPLNIQQIPIKDFLAFDVNKARFTCDIIAFVAIKKPIVAAQRFSGSMAELAKQIENIVIATTRDATTKKTVREIINDREGLMSVVKKPLSDTLVEWGLDLKDIELIDFKDPVNGQGEKTSQVISDLSSMSEVQINAEARQKNAEQIKLARLKEAEADEIAKKREIERDETVAKRDQEKVMAVAVKTKEAREKELEVIRVQQVKTATIAKEKAIVEMNQQKEVTEIEKTKKQLEGEGDKLRAEAQAKGSAAAIRENLLAEANGKEQLQVVLSKFDDKAIAALVAQQVVEKDKAIGVETARAFSKAEIKALLGGNNEAFDMARLLQTMRTGDNDTASAMINRLAKPNDLGFKG